MVDRRSVPRVARGKLYVGQRRSPSDAEATPATDPKARFLFLEVSSSRVRFRSPAGMSVSLGWLGVRCADERDRRRIRRTGESSIPDRMAAVRRKVHVCWICCALVG